MTRQQAAPRQGALPSPSRCRHSSLGSSGSHWGSMGPLPGGGIVSIRQGFPGRRSWLTSRAQRVKGARKVQRGAGEGWGREAGPARR